MSDNVAPSRKRAAEPPWHQLLREPFKPEYVGKKPQPWCRACLGSPDRVCGQHRKTWCPHCKHNITEAHVDLDYVGHADVTDRLLEVDPYWDWEPAYHDVNPEILTAAIATGNPEIVRQVIDNAPPLIDKNGGMWMILRLHDDDGRPVPRLGYGDAGTKSGPNAMKERIGDGIRNGAMRFGVALDQWSRSERDQGSQPEGSGRQITPAQSAQPAQQAGEPPARQQQEEAGQQEAQQGAAPQDPDDEAGEPSPSGNAVAIALAKLALQIAAKPDGTLLDLQHRVYEEAKRKKLLKTAVPDVFGDEENDTVQLTAVITEAKRRIEARKES